MGGSGGGGCLGGREGRWLIFQPRLASTQNAVEVRVWTRPRTPDAGLERNASGTEEGLVDQLVVCAALPVTDPAPAKVQMTYELVDNLTLAADPFGLYQRLCWVTHRGIPESGRG